MQLYEWVTHALKRYIIYIKIYESTIKTPQVILNLFERFNSTDSVSDTKHPTRHRCLEDTDAGITEFKGTKFNRLKNFNQVIVYFVGILLVEFYTTSTWFIVSLVFRYVKLSYKNYIFILVIARST